MKFIPDETVSTHDLPYLEDAKAVDGWKGQTTDKSIEKLRREITDEIVRLGGSVTRFQRGEYDVDGKHRPGVVIEYSLMSPAGIHFAGRMDVAGLPRRAVRRYRRGSTSRHKDQSLRMALFNIKEALQATRILEKLSPGYSALMPWLLVDGKGENTISQMYSLGSGAKALPAPGKNGHVIDATFREADA